MECPSTSWAHVLDDRLPAPPDWRLAWLIHGLPDPLPRDQYRDCFEAFEAEYGVDMLITALRRAVAIPPGHGTGVRTDELRSLLSAYLRQSRTVAA